MHVGFHGQKYWKTGMSLERADLLIINNTYRKMPALPLLNGEALAYPAFFSAASSSEGILCAEQSQAQASKPITCQHLHNRPIRRIFQLARPIESVSVLCSQMPSSRVAARDFSIFFVNGGIVSLLKKNIGKNREFQ